VTDRPRPNQVRTCPLRRRPRRSRR
jgi:hypothetical protein